MYDGAVISGPKDKDIPCIFPSCQGIPPPRFKLNSAIAAQGWFAIEQVSPPLLVAETACL
jgi:hypothetical protein